MLNNDQPKQRNKNVDQATREIVSWKIVDGKQDQTAVVRLLTAPLAVCKELFLPIDFPHSVREGYLEYQLYDSLQGLCSYLRGVLCSAQVLQAAGVGDESATAWGAALTWALKDGMGMIGGLAFSYFASPLFDAHVKEFRLFADLINDVALTLDMLAPYCSSLLLVSSASTLCKTLCGMSAAATKSNITVYFAIEGNMADLNAKESTQETLVSLLGMLCGVTLARWLQNYEQNHPDYAEKIQWSVFLFLTAVHVWANWQGVCILRLQSLNRERADAVLAPLFDASPSTSKDDYGRIELARPVDVNESLIVSTRKMIFPGRLCLNCTMNDIMMRKQDAPPSLQYLDWFAQRHKYIVSANPRSGHVQVCLLRGATNLDQLQAFCHAQLLVKGLTGGPQKTRGSADWQSLSLAYGRLVESWFTEDDSSSGGHRSLPTRLEQAGWDVHGRLYLGFSRVRTELVFKED